MSKTMTVKPGLTFRSGYADSNALWKVISHEGGRAWNCEIVDEPIVLPGGRTISGDYAGVVKPFMDEQIAAAIGQAEAISRIRDDHDFFYANLTDGQTIHYHNGFGQYVRCTVADGKLVPVAMVGAWRSYDLPRRDDRGTLVLSYYAEKIMYGEPMAPHASNLWEYPGFSRKGRPDPTDLDAIDLSIPEQSADETERAMMLLGVDQVAAILSADGEPVDRLRAAQQKITQLLEGC